MRRKLKYRAWNITANKMVDLHSITPLALSDTMTTVMAHRGTTGVFIPFDDEIDVLYHNSAFA